MFTSDVVLNLNPFAVRQMTERIAVGWINVIQECVAEAKKKSPPPPKIGGVPATGHNARSINPMGQVHSSGATTIDPNNIDGEVFTTSGYGGYLEVGTRKMPARPYIVPAVESVMKGPAKGILEGIL